MIKGSKDQGTVDAAKDRREFLKTAGKFGITAPMAALLLSVNSKKSAAWTPYGGYGGHGGPKGNNGFGNGGHDGTPNGFPDFFR